MDKAWLPPLRRFFGWLVIPFVWWRQISLGRYGTVFLMPNGMGIFILFMIGINLAPILLSDVPALVRDVLPGLAARWVAADVPAYGVALCFLLPVLPLMLLKAVWIGRGRVYCFSLLFGLPYWRHRLPCRPHIVLYQAWEDPQPTSIVLAADPHGHDGIHLGNAISAFALFDALGQALQPCGWERIYGDCYGFVGAQGEPPYSTEK